MKTLCSVLSIFLCCQISGVGAATVFDDDFLGSGGIPSGWNQTIGAGTISHSGSIVTISNPAGATAMETISTFSIGTDATALAAYNGSTGGSGFFGFGDSIIGLSAAIQDDGDIFAEVRKAGAVDTQLLTTIVGYSGGPIEISLNGNTTGFRLITSTGYDSGDIAWAAIALTSGFSWSDLGASSGAIVGTIGTPSSSVSLDRLTVSIATVPVPAAAWLFGCALAFVAQFRRRST